ncbi:DUF2442 domain-containing protein [Sediminibacterium sp.]|uniref:DUF2442 domain-containing protein n=1 Tax=Sediminibacterium sp. TaxID=1917865 RepID=UPI0027359915|nr:DUF2442 domain-containing protein [Sediminibacterium sp.]MDP3393049.1 DUF2442 domain-containing protein [Sediminibacterium sp.]MDP3567257.1 DUF2442 domain-containing protein [Sediminibacterium sp.]
MLITHHIETVIFDSNVIRVIIDGHLFEYPIEKISTKLALATDIERSCFKISPTGYGIHWPLIDEDISVDAFINKSLSYKKNS